MSTSYTVNWEGPFTLLGSGDSSFWSVQTLKEPGIYTFCWKIDDVYWAHYIGMTENFERRISQHIKNFLDGTYYIYDNSYLDKMEIESIYNPNKYDIKEFLHSYRTISKNLQDYFDKLEIFLAPLKRISERGMSDKGISIDHLEIIEAKLKQVIKKNGCDKLFDCGEMHNKRVLDSLEDIKIESIGKVIPKGFELS